MKSSCIIFADLTSLISAKFSTLVIVLSYLCCLSWKEVHGQAVLVLHWLLRQVVRLPNAADGAALARAHCVL